MRSLTMLCSLVAFLLGGCSQTPASSIQCPESRTEIFDVVIEAISFESDSEKIMSSDQLYAMKAPLKICSFRVVLKGTPLVYFGRVPTKMSAYSDDEAFEKCTLLKKDDRLNVEVLNSYDSETAGCKEVKSYVWRSGQTSGILK